MKSVTGLRAGWGDLSYDVEPDWVRADFEIGQVTAIAATPSGAMYVCHRLQPHIVVVDARGEVTGALGEGEVVDPHGIATDAEGFVYVVDRDRHVVVVYDTDGKRTREIGTKDQARPDDPFNHPADVTVDPTGVMYVADGYGNSRIHVLSPDGRHLRSWGEPGRGPGQFRVPHGIAVDALGRVYVADRENDRVQVFDSAGTLLDIWDAFRGPTDVYVDAIGRIFVSDHVPSVTALDPSGRVLVKIRAYHDTHGLCGDRDGNLFVASTAGRSVIRYAAVRAR